MSQREMTSMQRVMTTLAFKEPDRTPFFLSLSMHGARELGLDIKTYFSKAENVVEGQLRMRARYGHDCLFPFFCAALEVAAWGGDVLYSDNGPPNAGQPIIGSPGAISALEPPQVTESASLCRVLGAIYGLKQRAGDEVPIIGVVMSPFSLPVMQMGFEAYLLLMHEQPGLFWQLMRINEHFCIRWANAQLAAGATAICYFDPLASPTIIPRERYLQTGFKVACRVIPAIDGPTATHLASGRSLPIIDDLCRTGTQMVGVSAEEDLAAVKAAGSGRMAVLGNLNGVAMRRWTADEAAARVREAIFAAGPGGGFILADNHGEIPFQVPEAVLSSISEAVHTWGRYPLKQPGGRCA